MFKYYLIWDFSHFLLGFRVTGHYDLYGSSPHVFIDVDNEDHMVYLMYL